MNETYAILGMKLMNNFDSKYYVDWAVKMLNMGKESESLMILAGLDNEENYIREKFFNRSIQELGIEVKGAREDFLKEYAKLITQMVLNGKMSSMEGLEKIMEIFYESEFERKYVAFFQLEDDLSFIKSGLGEYARSGISEENAEGFINKEFKILKDVLELKSFDSLDEKVICNSCGEITKSRDQTKIEYAIALFQKYDLCGNCGSRSIDDYYTQVGRLKIINRKKKHP